MAANPFLLFALEKADAGLLPSPTDQPVAVPTPIRAIEALPRQRRALPTGNEGAEEHGASQVEAAPCVASASWRRCKRAKVARQEYTTRASEVRVTRSRSTRALAAPVGVSAEEGGHGREEERKPKARAAAVATAAAAQGPPGRLLPPAFCRVDSVALAPLLLGKLLRRADVVLRITEVEAYRESDTACHARFGRTARTAPLYGPAGRAYVYLCYGLHNMLNITADEDGTAAACLVRACEPVSGLDTVAERRGMPHVSKPVLLTGPGKVGAALGLTTAWTSHDLTTPEGLELLDGPGPEAILAGPRVGIDYASAVDVAAPWRFAAAGTAWVSAPRSSLKPWTP